MTPARPGGLLGKLILAAGDGAAKQWVQGISSIAHCDVHRDQGEEATTSY